MSDQPQETIGRSTMLLMASNYTSAFKALMELIDNPIDYRGERHLRIDVVVDKDDDRIMVRDVGGEGMNLDSLTEWLKWGEGQQHRPTDIGQYHIGGKLACIFLADHLQITCRRAGETQVWNFDDPEWGIRTELFPPRIVPTHVSDFSWAGSLPDAKMGFTQLTLRRLKQRRMDITRLKNTIANTYQTLLRAGVCTITVTYKGSTETITPPDIPWTEDFPLTPIPRQELDGDITVYGQIGGLDRPRGVQKNVDRIPAGVRTDFNGRTITYGESFGRKLDTRGTNQRLYGEISISGTGLLPTQNKEGWDKDSPGWQQVEALVKPIVDQVQRDLSSVAGKRPSLVGLSPTSITSVREDSPGFEANSPRPRKSGRRKKQSNQPVQSASRTVIPWDPDSAMIEDAKDRVSKSLEILKNSDFVRDEEHQALIDHLTKTHLPVVGFQSIGGHEPRFEWVTDAAGNRELRLNKLHPLLRKPRKGDSALFEAILTAVCLELRDEIPQLSTSTILYVLDELHWIDSTIA